MFSCVYLFTLINLNLIEIIIVICGLYTGHNANQMFRSNLQQSIIQPPLMRENLNPNVQSSSKTGMFFWYEQIMHLFQINITKFDNILGRKRLPVNPLSPLSAQKGYSNSFHIVCFCYLFKNLIFDWDSCTHYLSGSRNTIFCNLCDSSEYVRASDNVSQLSDIGIS